MGVCRIAESENRPISFWNLLLVDCVLSRLSMELFPLVFLALNTWHVVRELMASDNGSWPLVRS